MLAELQRRQILDDGYTLLRGAVPVAVLERAQRAINHSLGSQGLPPDQLKTFGSRSFCPELREAAAITDLFNASQARVVADELFGAGALQPVTAGQIALRFPQMGEPRAPGMHLDGVPFPSNGVPPGQLHSFTALVGVFLSDVPGPFAGNFSVAPGSHGLYQNYFREHGTEAFLRGEGMPPVELPPPVQIEAKAGDIALCHYQLAHGVAANFSPHVRYAVFFRLKTRAHDAHKRELLCDMWRDFRMTITS